MAESTKSEDVVQVFIDKKKKEHRRDTGWTQPPRMYCEIKHELNDALVQLSAVDAIRVRALKKAEALLHEFLQATPKERDRVLRLNETNLADHDKMEADFRARASKLGKGAAS